MNSSPWLVRPPQSADAAALVTITTATTPHHIRQTMAQTDGRFWTLTHLSQPIGYAALLPLPGLPHLFELIGGIAPEFRRQGAGSFLWQAVRRAVMGTAVQQITHPVPALDTPTACFLQHHGFAPEHEEWTMSLDPLPAASLAPPTRSGQLRRVDQVTAVRTLPPLYERCFAYTAWFQPYSAAEVSATWEPNDELWMLVVDAAPIGFAWLHRPTPNAVEIEPIGIVREKQGMGYGRTLLTTLLQQLQNRGIQSVSLGVWANNETAVRLYQSLGFRHVSSSYSLTYTLSST
ncbi:MAG: GNAT family N-acetyltransferase [Anaerolineaceae bacterium]|nr:GNAT family N-acetyltransferase [Anaerolineaceae bacterium]